jgi:aldehyde dehydrogenase (NAD+)
MSKPAAHHLLIGGKLVDGDRVLPVINPADGSIVAEIGCSSEDQARAAVGAAKAAQPDWNGLGWAARGEVLNAFADKIHQHADQLAVVVTSEQGKPLAEAKEEVFYTEVFVRHFAGMVQPEEILQDDQHKKIEVRYLPFGVVVGISPWNFPLMLPAAKLAPATLAGNTIVLKPAPSTPMSTAMLGWLAADVFPAGVVNTVIDQNDLGSFLTSHPDVTKIAFTGSTETGRKIMGSAASRLKRLTLELGGNDAAVILADVDVADTARSIYRASFYNAGQACLAVKRVYVEDSIYDEFCDATAAIASQAVVGDGFDPATQMGPIQNVAQYTKARHLLEVAKRDGNIMTGGIGKDGNKNGLFIRPTIVRDIEDGSELVDEEQFSPILPIVRVRNGEDGVERANGSDYALGGSVWSSDAGRARKLAEAMQSGAAWINHHMDFGPHIPFAGAKQSGIGVQWSAYGLREYMQIRVLSEARMGD